MFLEELTVLREARAEEGVGWPCPVTRHVSVVSGGAGCTVGTDAQQCVLGRPVVAKMWIIHTMFNYLLNSQFFLYSGWASIKRRQGLPIWLSSRGAGAVKLMP